MLARHCVVGKLLFVPRVFFILKQKMENASSVQKSRIKTVFLMDKRLIQIPVPNIFISYCAIKKPTAWNCAVEAAIEYSRIVWDIFPDQLIRFIVSAIISYEQVGSWNKEEQDLAWIKSCFAKTSTTSIDADVLNVSIHQKIRESLEALTVCSTDQLKELKSAADKSKVSNKGRVVCLTSILENDIIDPLINFIQGTISEINKKKLNLSQLQITECDFLLLNISPGAPSSGSLRKHHFDVNTKLRFDLISICADDQLVNCLKRLAFNHFDLSSTTIISQIPKCFKKVEVFHHKSAHECLLNKEPRSTPYIHVTDKGKIGFFETVKVKLCRFPSVSRSAVDNVLSTSIRWRISPFVDEPSFQTLKNIIFNSHNSFKEPMFFKFLEKGIDQFFILDAYNGEIFLQHWFEPKKSSIPVPIISPHTAGPTVSIPSNLSHIGHQMDSQTRPDIFKPYVQLNADSSKKKNVTPPSTRIELASKRTKTEMVNAHGCAIKKKSENDPIVSWKQPANQVGRSEDHQVPPETPKLACPCIMCYKVVDTQVISGEKAKQNGNFLKVQEQGSKSRSPGIRGDSSPNPTAVTNKEKEHVEQKIVSLNQVSLITNSLNTSPLNIATGSAVSSPENPSNDVASPSGSLFNAAKEVPVKDVGSKEEDVKIKLEFDDDIQFVCRISYT